MHSMFTHRHRLLVCILTLCAASLGSSACIVGDDPAPADEAAASPTHYEITVTLDGREIFMHVQIAAALSDHYRATTGSDLDRAAVEALVSERFNRMLDEGALELPADGDAEISLFIDHQVGQPGTFLDAQACLKWQDEYSTSYYITINDDLGCRRYLVTDYYDEYINTCTSTWSRVYRYSTTTGPTAC